MRRTAALFAAAAVTMVACGGATEDAEPVQVTAPGSTVAPADNSGLEPRPVALASGESVDFNSFLGEDVLFWFWAPW